MANLRLIMHKRTKGGIGEGVACTYLARNGFAITDRNYQKAWGEIDIVAIKDKTLHFVEVKSVTCRRGNISGHKPEDNVHGLKVNHIRRMIQTYIWERGLSPDVEFKFHVICVYMDMDSRTARIRMLENLII